jgi:phosphatidylglycerophosphate synthase
MSTGNPTVASTHACIVGQSPVRLWGLTSAERLRRQLKNAGVTRFVAPDAERLPEGSILFLRADHLFDNRIVQDLVRAEDVLLRSGRGTPVAAHVSSVDAAAVRAHLETGKPLDLTGLRVETPETLSSAYVEKLLKSEPAVVLEITHERRQQLERHLFDGSYKGVTDLVTKWVWPRPARWVAGLCARNGIQPNIVTGVGLLLVIVATVLFATASYAWGLLLAWIMTFLDTVDGKLARVTVASTPIGHVLDHGTDLVHPPFWYLAWGFGLSTFQPPIPIDLSTVLGVIVAGYIAGRLVEAAFTYWIGRFSIFTWRPVDSYFRLVMARRNPSLILLTVGWASGRADLGLFAVAVWTVASSVFLLSRLLIAAYTRATGGTLRPWLEDLRADQRDVSPLARPFARHAAVRN